ncbi:adenylate/guanylate cyclase domain-containing protein [Lyngbya aestuarii]|uniref:adenylate/guanylate cyclase domain-containing protein n=1 Tax=Lyngbya aestuarii TaxID=118322 RepID=UPI00403E1664
MNQDQEHDTLLQTTRHLLAEVQGLSSRLVAVNEIANKINCTLNLDEIFRVVGKKAKWLLDFNHCSICLKNYDDSCRLVTLFGAKFAENCLNFSEENPITRVLNSRKPQLNPQDCQSSFLKDYPSQLFIPLEAENQVIGSLNFAKTSTIPYTLEDLRIGNLLAVQVSAAIRNAKCFEEINKLLEEMNQLYCQLDMERRESDTLLLNILPQKIAHELKQTGKVKPVHYQSASVLFTDFQDFTKLAEELTPEELVTELDSCFSYFDMVCQTHNLEKLKTIGDSYMCVGGIPASNLTHAIDAVLAALYIKEFMNLRQLEKMQAQKPYWQIRIGIHSGPLIASVIGKKKFTYDVWGDTVNIASRLESSGMPGKINISQSTYELIKDFFECEYRGKIAAKNKGNIDMYFVKQIKNYLSSDPFGLLPNDEFYTLVREELISSHELGSSSQC